MDNKTVYINKYAPFAILYFFLNGFLLPIGLLYTALLTPFFLWWILRYPVRRYLPLFFIVLLPFVIIHFRQGVDAWFYIKSLLLLFSVYIFCLAFYQFLENCHSLRDIYRTILLVNTGMVVFCLLVLVAIPSLIPYLWNDNQMSLGNIKIQRLRMLTYEPSYYSTLLAPLVIYYLLKVFRRELPNPWLYAALVVIPLLLSLSFGVILGVAIALILLLLLNSRKTILSPVNIKYAFGIGSGLVLALGFYVVFFPNSIFVRRIVNVVYGKDLSFNGRTFDSFKLGIEIAEKKSLIWGTGLGQVKLQGLDIFRRFYNNTLFTINDIGIPNNLGDFLATFGLVAVAIKLGLEFYFFFKTHVSRNYYRMGLFLFIFIYQFTGSYIMNIAEYVIWILAFKENLFPEFNKTGNPSFTSEELRLQKHPS